MSNHSLTARGTDLPFSNKGAVSITPEQNIRELTQPRRRRQQERHKFPHLIVKNNSFARFARAVFISGHFGDVLVLSTT